MDMTEHGEFFRRDAVARGVSDNDLRTEKRRGVIESVSRGLYLPANVSGTLSALDRHLLAVRATLSRSSPGVVVSHQSAAVLHGFDMWNPTLAVVHVSSPRSRGGHRTTHRHLHADGLGSADVVEVKGLRVTTPARTIADLARALPFEQAVCVGDAGLRRAGITTAEVRGALDRSSTRGRAAAATAIAFMDARSESIGESRSRVYFHRYGLPVPALQVTVCDARGLVLGRPDFLWEDEGLAGEFDGMVKYRKHVRPGESAGDVVEREKLREDRFRASGWMVSRWTWPDLGNARLAERIAAALEVARRVPAPRTTQRR